MPERSTSGFSPARQDIDCFATKREALRGVWAIRVKALVVLNGAGSVPPFQADIIGPRFAVGLGGVTINWYVPVCCSCCCSGRFSLLSFFTGASVSVDVLLLQLFLSLRTADACGG